jgi:hypothetical protein
MNLWLLVFIALGFACAPSHDSGAQRAALADAVTLDEDRAGSATLDQQGAADRIATIGRNDSRVMEHLDYLTGRIGPRLAGSENHRTACEWARKRFAAFGLENAHLEKCADVAVGFNRGRSAGFIRSPISKELHFSTPAWTPGTNGKSRATAVMLPDMPGELANVSASIEGRWVLWRPSGDLEKDAVFIKSWDELSPDVAGVITPSSGEFIYTMGRPLSDWGDLPTTPTVILLSSEFDEIADLLSEGITVSLEFNIRNYFKKGPIPVHNVVADIPGTEIPHEYVIVGAHIDSHDGATGATDNGTGVAAVLEAARILVASGAKPKRTIRFVLFGGEEIGLVGSHGYVRDHPDLLAKISAVYNMDMGADYVSGITATEAMRGDFEQVFAPVKALDSEMAFTIDHAEFLPLALDCGGASTPSSPFSAGGCGSAPGPISPLNVSGCGAGVLKLDDGNQETVIGDSLLFRRIVKSAGCGNAPVKAGEQDEVVFKTSAGCGSSAVEDASSMSDSTVVVRRIAIGSSDHAPFLAAGVPAFSWTQRGKIPHPYYPHTQKDTFDQVVPRYQEHSATVIALAALRTANLDHLLSRENLQEEEVSAR